MENNYTSDELLKKLDDAEKRILVLIHDKKELTEHVKKNFITVIKRFGDKYSDEELAKKDVKDLEVIVDACSRFGDYSEKTPKILPLSHKTHKVEDDREYDLTNVFGDVNKEFNMAKYK